MTFRMVANVLFGIVLLGMHYKYANGAIARLVACEGNYANITCGSGSSVNILDANYGRTNGLNDDCSLNRPDVKVCGDSAASKRLVQGFCQGYSSCRVRAANSIFGDPCLNVKKYLYVTYSCTVETNFDAKPFGGRVYYFSKAAADWVNAEQECVKIGGHLTSIHNNAEYNFVVQESRKRNINDFWIGLSDLAVLNKHVWNDKTPFNYARWLRNEPSHAIERCVQYWHLFGGGWNDKECHAKFHYVCKV